MHTHLQGQTCIALGAQWGDEGKGKIVDAMSRDFDIVVRFQGGHNAGHTLSVQGRKVILHLIPSGILHDHCLCCIAKGVAVSPQALVNEIDELIQAGVNHIPQRLILDYRATLILPSHVALDQANERHLADRKIGTTGRGIGPAYEDATARRGLRIADLLASDMPERVKRLMQYHNCILQHWYNQSPCDIDSAIEQLRQLNPRLSEITGDVQHQLHASKKKGKRILFEGAQGVMLDIDQGTYPYVTSSNTLSSAVATGAGFSLRDIDNVIGICKVYTTRVGEGPFPTELTNHTGEQLQRIGNEFGATTGRPRRCGWLDCVALANMARMNGFTSLYLTKLDVFDSFENLHIGIEYQNTSAQQIHVPSNQKVNYHKLGGWQQPTINCRTYQQLPLAAREYIHTIATQIHCPIGAVSVGPERDAIIYC